MNGKLGFIGLGVMGGHMARHLSKHFDVIVFDIDDEQMAEFQGVRKAGSVEEVGKGADVVLLSLPGSEIVKKVVAGEGGLAGALPAGGVLIDTSTTEPVVSRALSTILAEKKIDFLDSARPRIFNSSSRSTVLILAISRLTVRSRRGLSRFFRDRRILKLNNSS